MPSLTFLQNYIWLVTSCVATVGIFLLFVEGAGSVLLLLGKNERERKLIFSAIDIRWRFPFAVQVLFIIIASIAFPGFQAENNYNGPLFWIFFMMLFVLHAAACEILRRYTASQNITTLCRWVILVCGNLIPFSIGFSGGLMITTTDNIGWMNFATGLLYVSATHISGYLYLYGAIADYDISRRIKRNLKYTSIPFIGLLFFTFYLFATADGLAYDADGYFTVVPLKYLQNIIEMRFILVAFIGGITLIFCAIFTAIFNSLHHTFPTFNAGVMFIILTMFFVSGFNNTALFPNFADPQTSLSIANSSAGYETLIILAIASLLLPLAAIYLWVFWRKVDNNK